MLLATCDRTSSPRLELLDLAGEIVSPLDETSAPASVFIFTSVDCPVSNRYAPEVQRLQAEFADRDVVFWLVYPNPAETPEAIEQHLKEYGYGIAVLRDPEHQLVSLTEATVTPEVAVFVPGGRLVYRGRIDDRYVDFGKVRGRPGRYDLEEVLKAVVAGEPVDPHTTKAVGCYISDMQL